MLEKREERFIKDLKEEFGFNNFIIPICCTQRVQQIGMIKISLIKY